ncbi:MAG: response regulator [Sphingobacteriaceae bacterium]|nr:response regulator [Sphingobacteriaceae bacterium]
MKKKILVVENDKEILTIISYLLTEEGYDVHSLRSAEGLISEIESYQPHAILLDIIVPGIEDTELCKAIKSTKAINHIPLIVLSTHPTVYATIKELCADEVISKPFDINNLVEIVSNQLAA